ncbi:lipoteichoic acid stability factor AuxB [Staphylococcus ratti]|uniref:DUF4064 domain-containing protein n=1 Tax=Staphylococcus ratti TaxID=2892440 RepID=A0ABY3PAX9_9STAP|nr:DUF4064 domain-containing protein [Staphylococcus ratti]UEX89455.1 DUF4064 domain-containing protein [Staphylococcus ratti]
MAYETYQQVVRPVSRIAEKILGWLSWIALLLTTIVAMFFGLVLFSNENSIQNIENGIANNETIQNFLANNQLTATQFVITMQNGVWAFIVYLIVCLLISFLALISMKHRIVSGLLFFLAAVITLPLFVILVPLFFLIIAIMMFARKPKVVATPNYYNTSYKERYDRDINEERGHYVIDEKAYERPTSQAQQHARENEDTARYENVSNHMTKDTDEVSESPQVLSRTAKYHHKPVKRTENTTEQSTLDDEDDTVVYQPRSEAKKQDTGHTFDSRSNAHINDESLENEQLNPEASKQQRKEERAQMKAQKKEARKARKAHEKAQRKLRPSASSQRRQNYDYRKQVQKERTVEEQETDSK